MLVYLNQSSKEHMPCTRSRSWPVFPQYDACRRLKLRAFAPQSVPRVANPRLMLSSGSRFCTDSVGCMHVPTPEHMRSAGQSRCRMHSTAGSTHTPRQSDPGQAESWLHSREGSFRHTRPLQRYPAGQAAEDAHHSIEKSWHRGAHEPPAASTSCHGPRLNMASWFAG